MKVCVIGAGALGCTYGAMLLRAGHDVTFVTSVSGEIKVRIAHLGLTIPISEDRTVNAEGLKSDSYDLVLFCAKSHAISPLYNVIRRADGPIMVLCNALLAADDMVQQHPDRTILRGCTSIETTRLNKNQVLQLSKFHKIHFGPLQGPCRAEEKALAKELKQAGLNVTASRDSWASIIKLGAVFVPLAALTAFYGKGIGDCLKIAACRQLSASLAEEYVAVAASQQVKVTSDAIQWRLNRMHKSMMSSVARDYQQGRDPQWAHLKDVIRLAEMSDVKVPKFIEVYEHLKKEYKRG